MNECGTKPECADIADRAVRKTFAILGVNIDNPESVEEFRQDLRFGKQLRKIASHGMLAFFATVAVAIAGAIWIGITSMLGHGK
jgi:hypothetical protein